MTSEYYRNQAKKYYWKNREAVLQKLKLKRLANPEFYRAKYREWHRKNKDKWNAIRRTPEFRERSRLLARTPKHAATNRKNQLRYHYGITPEKYDEMLKGQNGTCAICHLPQFHKNGHGVIEKYLHVDHCHKANKVRGLLCHNCNSGLGHFKDNVEFLNSAINYLKK